MGWIKGNLERMKTALIVLLALSAVALGLFTGLFDDLIQAGGLYAAIEERLLPELTEQVDISAATLPTTVMVGLGGDEYCGYRFWGGDRTGSAAGLYDLFFPNLGEALGSSGEPREVDEEVWQGALAGQGVYFRYDLELPGALLAAWLGTEPGGADGGMEQLCLALEDGAVALYYMGGDGVAYRCATAAAPESIREKMGDLTPNGALYAFQQEAYIGADEYSVLLGRYDNIQTLWENNALASVYAHMDDILEGLGMNLALVERFNDGRTIVESDTNVDMTVRIADTGEITYVSRGDGHRLAAGDGEPDLAQAVETARELAGLLNLISDTVDIYLTGWEETETGYVIYFGYYSDGLPIWTGTPAAQVVIDGGYVTEATLRARLYIGTNGYTEVVPETQMAAAAGEAGVVLAYAPPEGGAAAGNWDLEAQWLYAAGEVERLG